MFIACVVEIYTVYVINRRYKKVQVGNDQEKANQKKIPTQKTEAEKKQTNNKVVRP